MREGEQKMADSSRRDEIIRTAIEDAEKRSPRILASPSHLSDADWAEAVAITRMKGPLSPVEGILYMSRHDHFAKTHFLGLVFECERLHEIIRQLAAKSDTPP